mmetsp:Transcript_14618/g.22529  ORF Transcript_14618/g.22529 Transcript_14618/m.22529 type:complete len:332 (-) Transcript_14618:39-1034(-)
MSFGAPEDYFHRIMAASVSGQEQERSKEAFFCPQQTDAVKAYEYLEKYSPTNNGDDPQKRDEEKNEYEESPSKRRMVQWRGNYVSEREAKALRHVFDDMKDHFGHHRSDPDVSVILTGLTHPGGRERTWEGDLDFIYNIRGERCKLAYIGMEICIDLIPKLVNKRDGRPLLRDYGKTWVYAYLPEITMHKVKSYVRAGTGWEISDEGIIEDPNRNLVAIEARMHDGLRQPKPSFWVTENDDATSFNDSSSFSRIGSVQSVQKDTDQQQIHRGIGFFSVSMEIDGSSSKVKPIRGAKGVDDDATLIFTLTSFSTWGVTDSIAPIVHGASLYY